MGTDAREQRGKVQLFFARSLLNAALKERSSPGLSVSDVAKRDLERYYSLLRQCIPTFTEAEAAILVDACYDWRVEPGSASLLWARVDDAIRTERLDQEHGVDGPTFVARLRALTPFEAMAVCDAVERYLVSERGDAATSLRRSGWSALDSR